MPKKSPRRVSKPARKAAARKPAKKKAAPRVRKASFSKSRTVWVTFFQKLAASPTPPAITVPADDAAMFNSVSIIADALKANPELARQLATVGIDDAFLDAGTHLAAPLNPATEAGRSGRRVILPEESQQIQTATREYQDLHKAAVGAARIVAPANLKDFGLAGSYSLGTAKGTADAITKLLTGLRTHPDVAEHAAIDAETMESLRARLKTLSQVKKAKDARTASKKNQTASRNEDELALACWLDTYRTRVGTAFKGQDNLENRRTLLEALPRKVERRTISARATKASAEKFKASAERLKAATEKLRSIAANPSGATNGNPRAVDPDTDG